MTAIEIDLLPGTLRAATLSSAVRGDPVPFFQPLQVPTTGLHTPHATVSKQAALARTGALF